MTITETMFVERLTSGIHRMAKPPRYVAPHRARGWRHDGSTEWDEPESVCGRGMHRPARGKVSTIRRVPDFYQEILEAIDTERTELNARLAELRKKEAEICEMAYAEGKPVTVAELKGIQS